MTLFNRRQLIARCALLAATLLSPFTPNLVAQTATPAPAISKPLIAVLNAYPPEMDAMVKEFKLLEGGFTEKRVKGFRYYIGTVEGKDIVVFETGISMVNAAMALQLALERLPISHVLFAGVAGGTDPALRVGDVVIPEKWAYHSEAAYFNPTPDGKDWMKAEYFTKRYPNYGMIFPADMFAVRASKENLSASPTSPSTPPCWKSPGAPSRSLDRSSAPRPGVKSPSALAASA